MSLYADIKKYTPANEQEARDKEQMLLYMKHNKDYLFRENRTAHVTASAWTVNKERTKTLMVYHNIYNSWSWIGGHSDGEEDLRLVAMRELQEETGVKNAILVSPEIFSLELLTVNEAENSAVKWWTFEDALEVSEEPWFVEWIYKNPFRYPAPFQLHFLCFYLS